MKISLPLQVAGSKDALFVLEVEFPVATAERTVAVAASGPVEALDLRGSGPGGAYQVPMGLERLHVPMRVTQDGQGEATVTVRCTEGPERGQEAQRTLRLGPAPHVSGRTGAGSKLAVAVVVLALLGTAALWLYPTLLGGPRVPAVAGLTEPQARQKLLAAEYSVSVSKEETPDPGLQDRVLRTHPAEGEELARGSEVELVIGQPQGHLVKVPALRGQMEGPAVAALDADGFTYEISYDYEETTLPPGTVTRQTPQEDQLVERGTVVELWVAARRADPGPGAGLPDTPPGPASEPTHPQAPDPVPDLPPDAPAPEPPVATEPPRPEPQPEPHPVPDTPEATKPDEPGQGPPPEELQPPAGMVAVPELAGLTEREARKRLEALRLMALPDEVETADTTLHGRVMKQNPAPGSHVWPATQVFLSIGRRPFRASEVPVTPPPREPESIPPSPAEPKPAEPDTPQPEPADPMPGPPDPEPPVPAEPVPTQPEAAQPEPARPEEPAAPPASAGATERSVPDVIGVNREKATGDLKQAGLRYRLALEETTDVPDGQVLSQDPAAGSRVPEGTTVTLLVAQAPAAAPGGVQVPDVSGRPRVEAEQLLRERGFLVRATLGGSAPEQRDRVLAQAPPAGSMRPGRTWVEIVIGQPGLPARTPVGGPPPPLGPEAPPAPRPVDSGTSGQPPAPGTAHGPVQPGAGTPRGPQPVPPVALPPRDAPPTAVVPEVSGSDVHDAILGALKSSLLPILLVERHHASAVPIGRVVGQSPAPGTPALPGDLLRLGVYLPIGESERRVDLPPAVGMLLDRARQVYAARGIRVRVIEVDAALHPYAGTGRVAASYPVSLVPRSLGESVTLWVVR